MGVSLSLTSADPIARSADAGESFDGPPDGKILPRLPVYTTVESAPAGACSDLTETRIRPHGSRNKYRPDSQSALMVLRVCKKRVAGGSRPAALPFTKLCGCRRAGDSQHLQSTLAEIQGRTNRPFDDLGGHKAFSVQGKGEPEAENTEAIAGCSGLPVPSDQAKGLEVCLKGLQ